MSPIAAADTEGLCNHLNADAAKRGTERDRAGGDTGTGILVKCGF